MEVCACLACSMLYQLHSVNNIHIMSHFSTCFKFHTGLPANSASLTLPCLAIQTLCLNLMKMSKSRSSKFSFCPCLWQIHVIHNNYCSNWIWKVFDLLDASTLHQVWNYSGCYTSEASWRAVTVLV